MSDGRKSPAAVTAVTRLIPQTWPGPLRDLVIILLGLFVLILALVFLAGLVIVGEEIWVSIQSRDDARYGAARTAMLIFAGLLGAPFVLWRALIASRQVEINQESHYTELFTKAVEQLGAVKTTWQDVTRGEGDAAKIERVQTTERNIEVRLGAIYALERVMHDSPRDAGPIVETLAAYVRGNCREPVPWPEEVRPKQADFEDVDEWREAYREALKLALPDKAPADSADVRAALSVLGRRPAHARLPDAEGRDTIQPDLRAANLQGADLVGARLEQMDLRGARLEAANLDGARLEGAGLRTARLEGANLYGARLEGADLRTAQLAGVCLLGARLERANLFGAHLKGADLAGAGLERAHLRATRLEGADLFGAGLEGADLTRASLEGADLRMAVLRGAVLRGDCSKIIHDPDEFSQQIAEAFGHKTDTILPEGIAVPEHWSVADDRERFREEWRNYKKTLGLP